METTSEGLLSPKQKRALRDKARYDRLKISRTPEQKAAKAEQVKVSKAKKRQRDIENQENVDPWYQSKKRRLGPGPERDVYLKERSEYQMNYRKIVKDRESKIAEENEVLNSVISHQQTTRDVLTIEVCIINTILMLCYFFGGEAYIF